MNNEYSSQNELSSVKTAQTSQGRLERLRPDEQHRVLMYYAEVLPQRLKRGVYSSDQVDGMRVAVSQLPESPMRDEVLRQIAGHVAAAAVRL